MEGREAGKEGRGEGKGGGSGRAKGGWSRGRAAHRSSAPVMLLHVSVACPLHTRALPQPPPGTEPCPPWRLPLNTQVLLPCQEVTDSWPGKREPLEGSSHPPRRLRDRVPLSLAER